MKSGATLPDPTRLIVWDASRPQTLVLQTYAFGRQIHVLAGRFSRKLKQRHDKGLEDLCPWRIGAVVFLETEATAGIEPAMKVLQTSALPLGYVADERIRSKFTCG